ncbi:MAG: 3-phosphoshikimate 1-carboxyvinyltransferase, partial [Thermodesulfovibrionales bacterium]|nr:3-phosphoshikimate 1-carboxyvinyltransferase [Thermodesulfovibrionales bacterium]
MTKKIINKIKALKGELRPPADKSISHRALMLASLASGKSRIKNLLYAGDTISTMNAMKSLGVDISQDKDDLLIYGKGLRALKEPTNIIDCGNSGTTSRLISGILSGNNFFSVLTGDDSLRKRPMSRVIIPLTEMGAQLIARAGNKYLPMAIKGGNLKGIDYVLPVPSAQLKSCIMLAGLYAKGKTIIREQVKSRDHTERMLSAIGVDLEMKDNTITLIPPDNELMPFDIHIPADFSSAAFFITASLIVPNSEIVVKDVLLNETRTGFLQVIKMMGANVKVENIRDMSGESIGDIVCKYSSNLKAIKIDKTMMPSMIDEFPILCVLATQAEGVTEIRGAEELRVKESDRISAMAQELSKMYVKVNEYPDGIDIVGKTNL